MRNLKRLLSAALALVMSMSIASVASAVEFSDAADINYEEAVEVMSTIGVLEGFENGKFDPTSTLTREQAAKMIAYILLGSNYEKLATQTSRFTDVEPTRWSAPVIEYCAEVGIIAGNGDGTYAPTAELNGYAFAKMLLGALGYKAEIEGFTGAAWTLNVATYATKTGLDKGIENLDWSAPLSRETAAQMALNALNAPMVEYDNSTTVNIDGTTVTIGNSTAKYVVSEIANEQRISTTRLSNTNYYTVELGEQYFKGLRLSHDDDVFARPSYTWTYNTTEIGTYVDYTNKVAEYTTGVSGKTFYDLIGNNVIKEYTVEYFVDGAVDETIKASNMIRTNTYNYATTGNGVLTEVFVDHVNEVITITSINTYLAQTNADYNENTEKLSLTVFNSLTSNVTGKYGEEVTLDEVANVVDYKKDQFVLVNMAAIGANGRLEVVKIQDPEIMTNKTITKFSSGSYVVTDDTQYDYAKKSFYDDATLRVYDQTALTNYTYNLYLDQYGYVIGADVYEGQANYLFMTGYDLNGSNLAVNTATAGAIFLDGTFKEIQVNVTATDKNLTADTQTQYPNLRGAGKQTSGPDANTGDSEYNMWFTYSVVNDVYTLSPIPANRWANVAAATTSSVINSATLRVHDDDRMPNVFGYGNDASVYLTVDTGAVDLSTATGITKVTGTFTGVQNVDLKVDSQADNALTYTTYHSGAESSIFAVMDSNNWIIGAVVVGEDQNNTKNFAYGVDGALNEYVQNADGYYYWDFTAVVDGEVKTLTVKTQYSSVITTIKSNIRVGSGAMFRLTYDTNGYVVDAELCVDALDYVYGNSEYRTSAINPKTHSVYLVNLSGGVDILVSSGRSLYIDNGTRDFGVTLADNSMPVIVIQNERDSNNVDHRVVETYTSIASALNTLGDANYTGTNDVTKQFNGQISAVLNAQGTAEYLVINSATPVGVNTDIGGGVTTGIEVLDNDSANNFAAPKFITKDGTLATMSSGDIYNMLLAAGCKDISVGSSGWNFTLSNGLKVTGQTIAPVQVAQLTLPTGVTASASGMVTINGKTYVPNSTPVTLTGLTANTVYKVNGVTNHYVVTGTNTFTMGTAAVSLSTVANQTLIATDTNGVLTNAKWSLGNLSTQNLFGTAAPVGATVTLHSSNAWFVKVGSDFKYNTTFTVAVGTTVAADKYYKVTEAVTLAGSTPNGVATGDLGDVTVKAADGTAYVKAGDTVKVAITQLAGVAATAKATGAVNATIATDGSTSLSGHYSSSNALISHSGTGTWDNTNAPLEGTNYVITLTVTSVTAATNGVLTFTLTIS